MKRHLVTVALLILAAVLYFIGAAGPATGLIVLGMLAEGAFWFRIFGGGRR